MKETEKAAEAFAATWRDRLPWHSMADSIEAEMSVENAFKAGAAYQKARDAKLCDVMADSDLNNAAECARAIRRGE